MVPVEEPEVIKDRKQKIVELMEFFHMDNQYDQF